MTQEEPSWGQLAEVPIAAALGSGTETWAARFRRRSCRPARPTF